MLVKHHHSLDIKIILIFLTDLISISHEHPTKLMVFMRDQSILSVNTAVDSKDMWIVKSQQLRSFIEDYGYGA